MAPMFERASGLFHGVQRTMLRFGTWILAAWLTVLAGSAAWAERVTLYAAASLRTALDTLAPELEAATGHDLRIAYGGSSKLARQIEQGAPADIFISANKEWIEYLLTGNRIIAASGVDLLSNRLVLIGQRRRAANQPSRGWQLWDRAHCNRADAGGSCGDLWPRGA